MATLALTNDYSVETVFGFDQILETVQLIEAYISGYGPWVNTTYAINMTV